MTNPQVPHEEPSAWRPTALAAGVCLAALAGLMLLETRSPEAAQALALIAFVAGLWFPAQESAEKLAAREMDVDFLMIVVALGAWLVGHPEEGAALLVLFNASRAMEGYAQQRTRSAISALMAGMPEVAHRLNDDGSDSPIAISAIVAGDRLLVRPGERFPVDAKVVQGRSTADVAALTGESDPVDLATGHEVPSGAINGTGLIQVEALRPATESAYQKIVQLVEEAPARRSPQQELADRVGRVFTFVILSVSIAAGLVWWLSGLEPRVAAYRAMVLLVAGSPCALVLSIPSAVLSAIAAGARRGILANGGRGLLAAASVRAVALDKTGTLTTGEPTVQRVLGTADEQLLDLAAQLAAASTHPAARAVLRFLGDRAEGGAQDVQEQPGVGVRGVWRGRPVQLGRAELDDAFEHDLAGSPRVALSVDGSARVVFALGETLRGHAGCAIAAIRAGGRRVLLLSGDHPAAAKRMAHLVGITDAFGGLRPEDKNARISELDADGGVMMVGDGVNDAPALAAATVGVAMGMRASAATLAQADIVLAHDRLTDIPAVLDLSRRVQRAVTQNMTIAIGAAAIMLVVAAFGALPLALGVFGHEGGTVLVVLNSLRLLGWSPAIEHQRAGTREALALRRA